MCGISGVLSLDGAQSVAPDVIERMARQLAHRGPDDSGCYRDSFIGMGFRRLSIIDLSGGHQPLSNEDESIWCMCNGEIYNFQDLRSQLEGHGHVFRTHSDTETVLHAYEQYGLDFVSHLRGMFAVALWDRNRRRLLLVRDRVGKKPLYYSVNHGQLAFASELKALLAWPGMDRTLDCRAVHDYLSFLYVPGPRSIFQHVRKVPPGHLVMATVGSSEIQTSCYWELRSRPDYGKSRRYFVDGLRQHLEDSVRLRLQSDVSLGAFLSGGVDSTAVVGLMSRQSSTAPVKTFSIGFEERRFDETRYARLAARAFGTDHHEEVVGPIDIDHLEDLVWFLDEPFADSSAIPTYQVSKIARGEVTVALSGDGGDELFAGYPRYRYARWLRRLSQLPRFARRGLGHWSHVAQNALGGHSPQTRERLRQVSKALHLSDLTPPEQSMALLTYFGEAEKEALYSDEFSSRLDGYVTGHDGDADSAASRTEDPIMAFMDRDLRTNLPDDSLVKVDRMSMACSLEVRCPLLDHRLIEFAATIPPQMKLQGSQSKILLKEALADLLPSEIVHRDKWGFAVPFGNWFQAGAWKALLEDCLSTESVARRGMFNPATVSDLRRALISGSDDPNVSTHQLWHRGWALLMLELWARRYMDGDGLL